MEDCIHQIRCPICDGRLFDVITQKNEEECFSTHFAVLIKCWKCHKTITLGKINNYDYLVQASHAYTKIGSSGVEA